ncbi:hypothetical protein PAXRUDRAFT_165270, partial [Paxillus rubicundulus Ve08.2h10]
YQSLLQEAYEKVAVQKSALLGMQLTAVLQALYCDHLSEQLVAQEEKQKKRKTGQLNGDGLPRLLTGDKFYNQVVEHQKTAEEVKIEHENHQKLREAQSGVMAAWKEADDARKKRNKDRREGYHEELRLWEVERDLAKQEKRQVGWAKPKLGKLEASVPKPVVDNGAAGNGAEEGDDGNDDGNGEGIDSDSGNGEE